MKRWNRFTSGKTAALNLILGGFLLSVVSGFADPVSATGGDLTTYVEQNGTQFKVHVFTVAGTLEVEAGGEVDYLIVAGGGGGGSHDNLARCVGGGGAGGVLSGSLSLTNGSYMIGIGGGGAGGVARAKGVNGGNTTGFGFVAIGGGGGALFAQKGSDGGSGGGGSTQNGAGGTGTTGQGFAGGNTGPTAESGGGGGGGAGAVGQAAVASVGGKGGIGLDFSSGIAFGLYAAFGLSDNGWFAGGGGGQGGSTLKLGGTGGLGGGGQGGQLKTASSGADAMPHTGGGGGGGQGAGGEGGSGVVIVRYAVDGGDVPFMDVDAFTLADPHTGSTAFTSSNKVNATAYPVLEGFDQFQITTSDTPDSLTSNWLEVDAIPSTLLFTRPEVGAQVTFYAWFTNTTASVTMRRSAGSIFYTEVAPQVAARPFVRRFLAPGGQVEIALTDFLPPRGGTADERELAIHSIAMLNISHPSSDLTPEDPTRVTLGDVGVYSLVLRVENEAGSVIEKQLEARIAALPPDMRSVFVDDFSTGTWQDSDKISNFWSRNLSSGVIEQVVDTVSGRLVSYCTTVEGNKLFHFYSQNQAMFNFSERTITLRLVDFEQILPRSLTLPTNWHFGVGFGKDPKMNIIRGIADSIHFNYEVGSGSVVLKLYKGANLIGSVNVNGTGSLVESNYNKWLFPVNIELSVGPVKAVLTVELTDGTIRTISGAHGFDAATTAWMQAPALNLCLHASVGQGAGNPIGFSMDSILVTTSHPGTVLLIR